MSTETLLERINAYASRANPYPLYAELREHGVARQNDGSYLVGTYREIAALLHDPRISSDVRHRTAPDALGRSGELPPSFIGVDDPEHDRLRRLAMRPFGPPHSPGRVDALHGDIGDIARELIDGLRDRDRIDLVDDFAYPLPVTVICRLLGVPGRTCPRSVAGRTPSSPPWTAPPTTIRRRGSVRARRRGSRWPAIWAGWPTAGGSTRPTT